MKKTIILILILLPVVLYCSTDSTKSKKIAIGISFSPDYCFRTLKPDANSKWIADSRDTMEIPKIGYTTGINLEFKINKKISFFTGILFSDSGEKTKKNSLENVPTGQKPIKHSYNFHYYYLNIPIKTNYHILTGKFKLYLTAGISANVFLTQKTTSITIYGNSESKINSKIDSGFSRINIAMLAGCGISYPINNKAVIMIEPVYRRSIISVINAPIKGYLYSAGLNIGLYYNL